MTNNEKMMNKTAGSANINAKSDDKDEDWFFRSVNRAKRDQVLDVKEDFKKQRPHFYNTNYIRVMPRVKGLPFKSCISRTRSEG